MKKNNFRFFQFVIFCLIGTIKNIHTHAKVCIIIPAYNEEQRIELTLKTYATYFQTKPEKTTFLVVANNCNDKTVEVAQNVQKNHNNIEIINLKPGGKGFAVKQGFLWALQKDDDPGVQASPDTVAKAIKASHKASPDAVPGTAEAGQFDLIGFVDADMATKPEHFYDLIIASKDCDGAIASRYADGAIIEPERHWFRKMCGKIYNWILRQQFRLPYKDTQCGAKIFTYDTIKKVAPDMQEQNWAWDLEFLYLCSLEDKKIKEIPTVWTDQPGTHLEISTKIINEFTCAPGRIKSRHAAKKKTIMKQKKSEKSTNLKNSSTHPIMDVA